jgi:two-component system sensor histidine kinase/response regulator
VLPADIMIVDDNPANLNLLEDMLSERGYEIRSFPLGRLALAAAIRTPPDLILLDINMPEMNGYEVCERLKATEKLADIPVIFLSALNETQDKVKAFRSGAVDYISKPFQIEEVHARVDTHLKLHELRRTLLTQNERLEEAVKARTLELERAKQRLTILDRSKNEFLSLISHEFRTPLNGLLGVGEIILLQMPDSEDTHELTAMFEESRRRILSILDDALLMAQIDVNGEQFRLAPVSLHGALIRAIERTTEFADSRVVPLNRPAADPCLVLADEGLLVRALHALLETAVKFSEKGRVVRMSRGVGPDPPTVVIESRGRTIPDAILAKFFDLFSVGESMTAGGDLGLGPPMASRILALFGASVSVANADPPGIRLTISLTNAAPGRPDSDAGQLSR